MSKHPIQTGIEKLNSSLRAKDTEIARLEAELKETNSQMAAVQYQSLQIAGQRDDLTRQLAEAQGRIERAIEYMKEWGNWRTNTVDITKLKQILQGKEG